MKKLTVFAASLVLSSTAFADVFAVNPDLEGGIPLDGSKIQSGVASSSGGGPVGFVNSDLYADDWNSRTIGNYTSTAPAVGDSYGSLEFHNDDLLGDEVFY